MTNLDKSLTKNENIDQMSAYTHDKSLTKNEKQKMKKTSAYTLLSPSYQTLFEFL